MLDYQYNCGSMDLEVDDIVLFMHVQVTIESITGYSKLAAFKQVTLTQAIYNVHVKRSFINSVPQQRGHLRPNRMIYYIDAFITLGYLHWTKYVYSI